MPAIWHRFGRSNIRQCCPQTSNLRCRVSTSLARQQRALSVRSCALPSERGLRHAASRGTSQNRLRLDVNGPGTPYSPLTATRPIVVDARAMIQALKLDSASSSGNSGSCGPQTATSPKILLTETVRWPTVALLAIDLARAGNVVSALCPANHPLLKTRAVSRSFRYSEIGRAHV